MRVITGTARGRKLKTLEGMDVRPTTDKVKEAIFSTVQFDIPGATVLDLFAGSGQLGIEALSRGAVYAVFIDKARASVETVRENLQATGLAEKTRVATMEAIEYLQHADKRFDIAFLDPPYEQGILEKVLPYLAKIMNDGGKVICEHEVGLRLAEEINGLHLKKIYKYGKIEVTQFCMEREAIECEE